MLGYKLSQDVGSLSVEKQTRVKFQQNGQIVILFVSKSHNILLLKK